MTLLARGYSFVMYTAEAGATYTIPFPFLSTDDIRVFAGDAGDAVEQTFTWDGPTALKVSGSVTEGILITIRRFTPRETSMVTYTPGAQLPAEDLNLNTKQLLYIMQEQIDFGTNGGTSGLPGGGSGWPNPDGQPSSLAIQQIIDALMQSPTMQLLVQRMEPVDNLAETVLEGILRSDEVFDTRRTVEQRVATVETRTTELVTEHESTATQVTDLYAQHDALAAQVVDAQQAIANETEARATAVQQVNAAVNDVQSNVTSVSQALATETSTRAQAITDVRSDFAAADASATQAIYQQVASTYATPTQAKTIATSQVEAWASDNYAILQERFNALVDGGADPSATPHWQANWTVRINAGQINGTPVIAGIGLGVDSKTGSNFIVMADRFGIVSPTYTSAGGVQQMKYPFVVGTVGGVSTVGITGQLIVDGSITANKITTNTLSAISANMGEVNGGTFKTHTLDAYGNVTNPNEFRVELTNKSTDSYPVWMGSGSKTANNAVFFVDRSGNAKFAGEISARNMIDQLQVELSHAWTGEISGDAGGSSDTFTLPAPTLLGQQHTPVLMIELIIYGAAGDSKSAASGYVHVDRLDGSTWVAIRESQYGVQSYTNASSTMIINDTPTTAAQTYRVSSPGGLDGDFRLRTINVYAFGKR